MHAKNQPHLTQFGLVWPLLVLLAPFGPVRPFLSFFARFTPFDPVWHHLAQFGTIRPSLAHLALLGHSSIFISKYFKVPIRQGDISAPEANMKKIKVNYFLQL